MKRKSGFWTVLFSLFPGAGQMYQGYMKRGVSLMGLFWAVLLVAALLNVPELSLALPVVFCYAFFDSLNIRSYTFEEAQANPDTFLFFEPGSGIANTLQRIQGKGLGIALVALGGYLLMRNCYSMVMGWLWRYSEWAYRLIDSFMERIPALAVGVVIILLGIHLIRGGKKARESLDDVTTYRG